MSSDASPVGDSPTIDPNTGLPVEYPVDLTTGNPVKEPVEVVDAEVIDPVTSDPIVPPSGYAEDQEPNPSGL